MNDLYIPLLSASNLFSEVNNLIPMEETFEDLDISEEDEKQAWMNEPQETEDVEDVQDEREYDLEDEDDEYRREEEEESEEEENDGDPRQAKGATKISEAKK
jgi:hypothetical protein